MAEPTKDRLKSMVNTFLCEYNKTSKREYHWDDDKSYLANSKDIRWADAVVFDNKDDKLYLQHKEVVWDVFYDKIRSGKAEKAINELIQKLHDNGLNQCFVSLNFDSKIPEGDNLNEFIFYTVELVRTKLDNEEKKDFKFSYDKYDDIYLDKIKKYVSYIHIFKKDEIKKPIVGWGYSELQPRPLPHYGDRVVSEIDHQKDKSYEGVVLLMEANTVIDGIDLEDIQNGLPETKVRTEVWLVEDFISSKRAFKLTQ